MIMSQANDADRSSKKRNETGGVSIIDHENDPNTQSKQSLHNSNKSLHRNASNSLSQQML